MAHRWRGHVAGATQVYADALVAPRGVRGAGSWRAHGLVGPGKSIREVTQYRYIVPHFIHELSSHFLHVGLSSWEMLNV